MTTRRLLTTAEIDTILAALPVLPTALADLTVAAHAHAKDALRRGLQRVRLIPSQLPQYADIVRHRYYQAWVPAGEKVGSHAAEVIGSKTQETLDLKRGAGGKEQAGISYTASLFRFGAKRIPSLQIYFKEDYASAADLLAEKRVDLLDMSIATLLATDPRIDTPAALPAEWWEPLAKAARGVTASPSRYICRLSFNLVLLYQLQIGMTTIIDSLELISDGTIIALPSPFHLATVDIYVNDDVLAGTVEKIGQLELGGLGPEERVLIFLTQLLVPKLAEVRVSGVAGITSLEARTVDLYSTIVETEVAELESNPDAPDAAYLYHWTLNQPLMRANGVRPSDIQRLADGLGVQIVTPIAGPPLEPAEWFSWTTFYQTAPVLTVYADRPPVKIWDARKKDNQLTPSLIFLESSGGDYRQILARDDVDETRTISDDPNAIQEVFGVEGARRFFVRRMIDLLGGERSPQIAHQLITFGDLVYVTGEPAASTKKGFAILHRSAAGRATYEGAEEAFSEAALSGIVDTLSGMSEGLFTGTLGRYGSGAVTVLEDLYQQLKTTWEKRGHAGVDVYLSKAVGYYQELLPGDTKRRYGDLLQTIATTTQAALANRTAKTAQEREDLLLRARLLAGFQGGPVSALAQPAALAAQIRTIGGLRRPLVVPSTPSGRRLPPTSPPPAEEVESRGRAPPNLTGLETTNPTTVRFAPASVGPARVSPLTTRAPAAKVASSTPSPVAATKKGPPAKK